MKAEAASGFASPDLPVPVSLDNVLNVPMPFRDGDDHQRDEYRPAE